MRFLQTRAILLLPVIISMLGCGKPRLIYDVEDSFRTGAYRTVAPDPRKDRIFIRDGRRPLNPELHLRAALKELATRRYQAVPAAEADLWVATYVLIGSRPEGGHGAAGQASRGEGSGEGHHRGGRGGAGTGGPPPSASGREGRARSDLTIIVILEDRKTGRPVWHGEMSLGSKDRDTEGHPLGIDSALHQLLEPLPFLP